MKVKEKKQIIECMFVQDINKDIVEKIFKFIKKNIPSKDHRALLFEESGTIIFHEEGFIKYKIKKNQYIVIRKDSFDWHSINIYSEKEFNKLFEKMEE